MICRFDFSEYLFFQETETLEREMENMVRTELKRAFCSKSFWVTCGITLAMLAFGSSDYLPLSYATVEIPKPWWIYYFRIPDDSGLRDSAGSGWTGVVPGRGSSCWQSLSRNEMCCIQIFISRDKKVKLRACIFSGSWYT